MLLIISLGTFNYLNAQNRAKKNDETFKNFVI